MSQRVRDLVDAAAAGSPVYISALRERFEGLPPSSSFLLVARLEGFDAEDSRFTFTLPKFGPLDPDERTMVTEYVLAGLYNIISTLGGRGVELASDGDEGEGAEVAAAFGRDFGIGQRRLTRPGYGRAVNVSERMDDVLSPEGTPSRGIFRVTTVERAVAPLEATGPAGRRSGIAELCALSTSGLAGTTIGGMDVGGTDIKLCLAVDGRITRLLEYDWFPTAFTRIDELIDPILVLVRLMRLDGARAGGCREAAALSEALAPAFAKGAGPGDIERAVLAGEALLSDPFALDAIGLCFPDVVVRDRIVGGEVYKTRGMRAHLGEAYESEFRRLSSLDAALRPFVKPGGVVGIVNDGPMAAFTAAVEVGSVDSPAIADGVFAHTLGTELGTGWVTDAGSIPDIPLEIYNCIIDLGSYPERAFAPDDVRSVNNFNTRLAGTLQKYTSQSGVFRLAAKYLPEQDPALFSELVERGLLTVSSDGLFVPTEPRDMRKPLLEFLMSAAEHGGHPAVDRIFRELGEFTAVAWLESKWLLDPAVDRRILFGRLVKRRACFDLMVEGARTVAPALVLEVADDEMANTELMRQLRDSEGYTVAQFAQAIGAVHYANYRRHRAADARPSGLTIGVGAES
jgi:hypothetical protein